MENLNTIIKVAILTIGFGLVLSGCNNGDSVTYEKGSIVPPEEPAKNQAVIVSADNGSKVGVQYTQLEDGSILLQCGDGDNYTCAVYEAQEVIPTEDKNDTNTEEEI